MPNFDKTIMFGEAKFIITGFKKPLKQIYTFVDKKAAEKKLAELKKQNPHEQEIYIDHI